MLWWVAVSCWTCPARGLLLVLAGLVILSTQLPAVEKFVGPVRERAVTATEQSACSPWRIAGSALAGLALIVAGVV